MGLVVFLLEFASGIGANTERQEAEASALCMCVYLCTSALCIHRSNISFSLTTIFMHMDAYMHTYPEKTALYTMSNMIVLHFTLALQYCAAVAITYLTLHS